MSELTPITRVESYLDAIVNSGTPPLEDITRIETFLQAIYDNQVCALTPITRIEMFLGKISGQDIELPQPITRAELYLAAIAGEDVELPENPVTRLEMYLAEWADSGDWTTISGAIVEFITQRAHKLKSCVVSLSPKQDLSHGDPSPTNICPISGWTGVSVWDAKDIIGYLFNVPFEQGAINGASGNNPQPYAYYKTNNNYRIRCVDLVYLPRDNEYYVSFNSEVYDVVIQPYNESGFSIEPVLSPFGEWRTSPFSFVSTGSVAIAIRRKDGNLIAVSELPDINFGEKTSYSVTWEDEVFGAQPDVVSGEMPVTWEAYSNMDTINWSYLEPTTSYPYGLFYASFVRKKLGESNYLMSNYKLSTNYFRQDIASYGNSSSSVIYVMDSRFNGDITAFKQSLVGQTICYELATPTDITTTPTPITALKGYNAVWSDAGDVTVTAQGEPVVEPDVQPLQALNLLLGGAYHNAQTQDDVPDDEALDIILGGENE